MDKELTHKQVVEAIKRYKWHSETAPMRPAYCTGFTYGYVNMKEWFGIGHLFQVLTSDHGIGTDSSIIEYREILFNHIRKKGYIYLKNLYREWRKGFSIESFENADLRKKSDRQLFKFYNELIEKDIWQWSFSLITESTDRFSNDDLIPLLQKECKASKQEISDASFYLCLEPMLSFMQRERLDFLNLCKDNKKAQQHAKKWHWISNNYDGSRGITKENFLSLAKEHIKKAGIKEIEKEKNNLLNYVQNIKKKRKFYLEKYNFSKKTKDLLKILTLTGKILDERKEIMLRVTHVISTILKEISKRTKVPFEELEYYISDEINSLMKGKKTDISGREKYMFMMVSKNDYALFSGVKAKKILDIFEKHKDDIKDLKGFVACTGNKDKHIAKITVIKDPKKDKMKEDNILVAHMTRPDFVPLMRKASGIITDEGGISCHAAIVSRELNKPCIVGVQAGTKILKNNDKVEMNLRHGLVRKV